MTEYKCKRGFKIDIPEDKCDNEPLVHISEPKYRAMCAFCTNKEEALMFRKSGAVVVDSCDFIRVDLSWDDWEDEE